MTHTERPLDFLLSRVLYRDAMMLVIDKPAGLVVHAKPGASRKARGESLEDYFDALRFGLPRAPALAHRLDRDTTGCLVLGRHPKALRRLHQLFFEGKVEKTYLAICRGAPARPSGTIDAALVKQKQSTSWRMSIAPEGDPSGRSAVTTYRTLESRDGLFVIEAKPKTGRTHQIRVHLASIGAPILGDPIYGTLDPRDRDHPMMLHAKRIVVPISNNKEAVSVEASPPAAMQSLLERINADR